MRCGRCGSTASSSCGGFSCMCCRRTSCGSGTSASWPIAYGSASLRSAARSWVPQRRHPRSTRRRRSRPPRRRIAPRQSARAATRAGCAYAVRCLPIRCSGARRSLPRGGIRRDATTRLSSSAFDGHAASATGVVRPRPSWCSLPHGMWPTCTAACDPQGSPSVRLQRSQPPVHAGQRRAPSDRKRIARHRPLCPVLFNSLLSRPARCPIPLGAKPKPSAR